MLCAVGNRRRFALLLGAILLLAPRAFARGVEDTDAILPRWSWATTPEHLGIARALRESRRADSAPAPKLVDRIVGAGPGALEAQVDILARRRVPEAGPDDPPQVLSDPQRELVLAALARMPGIAVRAAIRTRLDSAPADVGTRLAAIHVIGTIGDAGDLVHLVELAPRGNGGEKALTQDAREAVRAACGAILRRDARAWPALADVLRRTDADAGRPLLEAVGSSRDPRALEVLYAVTLVQRDLRPQIAALASACGASTDAALNREFAAWLVSELPSARPEYARSLLQAVGVLDDGTCVPEMIARLSDKDDGVRDSALWALRRVSGLAFPAEATPWLVWNRSEITWQTSLRPSLRADLASRDSKRIIAALRAYGEHRTKRAELARDVVKVLADSRPELRRLACEVLQALGVASASGALAGALQDSNPSVSEAAWKALKAITGLDLPRDPKRVREMLLIS